MKINPIQGSDIFFECKLSKREQDCAKYFTQGMSCREVGKVLSLSPRTVETHLQHMKEKFKCRTKSQLIFKLIQEGFGPYQYDYLCF